MIIDERIFNELEEIQDTGDGRYIFDSYIADVWGNMAEKEKRDYCEGNGIKYSDDPYDDAQDTAQDSIAENIAVLYRIPKDSLLEHALLIYGKTKLGAIGLFDTCDKLGLIMIDDEAYFDSGYGYDIVDEDLLGGTGNGDAKQEFLKIINENN